MKSETVLVEERKIQTMTSHFKSGSVRIQVDVGW